MKTLIVIALSLITSSVFAQQIVEWKGGTPGNEQSWTEARNWSTNAVPDENSIVVIKYKNTGHNAQPVIQENVHIVSLALHSGSTLNVEEGSELLVDGTYTYSEGISNFGGKLNNQGTLSFINIDHSNLYGIEDMVAGVGNIMIDGFDTKALLVNN